MGCLMDVDYFILLHVSTSMDDLNLHIRIRVKVSKTSILLGFPKKPSFMTLEGIQTAVDARPWQMPPKPKY